MPNNAILVFPDAASLARAAVQEILESARTAIASRGQFRIALAGGSTPEATYKWWATLTEYDTAMWQQTSMFFGDERFVPHDAPESNYGMARRALLDLVPVGKVFAVDTDCADVEQSAAAYEKQIRSELGENPVFDIVLLGLGDDGHTASLFPGKAALEVSDRFVTSSGPGVLPPPVDRVTLTFPAINSARRVVFLVSGEKKADVVHKVLRESPTVQEAPAAGVTSSDDSLTWMLTEDAATRVR